MDSQTTVDGLFSQKIEFRVPSYQRAYSWRTNDGGNDQVGQFLRDIKEQPEGQPYFLGHFLFELMEEGTRKYNVVDGQQRLTTIVIFMSCLLAELKRREISEIRDVTIREIEETYLRHYSQKFLTVKEDLAYFQARIIDGDENTLRMTRRKSEANIEVAAAFFAAQMAEASTDSLAVWFYVVRTAVVTTFEIKGVNAKPVATQIFAFQNDRGKGLTTLEKVKAFLMNRLYQVAGMGAEDLVSSVECSFGMIYSQSEAIANHEDAILKWHCQVFLRPSFNSSMDVIREEVDKADDVEQRIVCFAAGLAQTFRIVREIELSVSRFSGYIADVCYLDKQNAMPMIIKLWQLGFLKEGDEQNEALRLLEQILFKLTFSTNDMRTNNIVKIAFELTKDNYDDFFLPALRHAAAHGFQTWWDFNGGCLRYFEENRCHYTSSIKYVYYKYENYLREINKLPRLSIDECVSIFREKKTLENTLDHIMPQNPDFVKYDEDFVRRYLSNLGNLSLLTWSGNAAKSNHDPTLPAERERYNQVMLSQKEIYTELCKGEWGKAQIDNRRNCIVEFVKKNWELG